MRTPKNRGDYSIFPQKAKVLETHLVKIKNPTYGKMPTVMDKSVKYGRRIHLSDQHREGPHWKAQEKYSDCSSDEFNGDNKCMSAWPRLNIRQVYKIAT